MFEQIIINKLIVYDICIVVKRGHLSNKYVSMSRYSDGVKGGPTSSSLYLNGQSYTS